MSEEGDKPRFPGPAVLAAEGDLSYLRSLDAGQHGELLIAACRAASAIEQGRRQSGLSPSSPAPWPLSTQQFHREWADHVRATAERD